MSGPAPFPVPALGRRDYLVMLEVAVFAFVVRLIYLISYSRTPYWDALVMDPVPSPLEAQRAETERRAEMRAEAEDQEERSSQRRAEENVLIGEKGRRIDRYA